MPDNETDDVPIYNPSLESVPAGGLAQIVSIDPASRAAVIGKPSYNSQRGLIVVGRFGVQPQSGGFGSFRPRVVLAYDGTLGAPAAGSNLGSVAGSYLAGLNRYGFVSLGGTGPVYTNAQRADEKATNPDNNCTGYEWINALDKCNSCLKVSILEVSGACAPTPKTYNCITVDDVPTCVDPGDATGLYKDLNHCLATGCAAPPPPPPGPSFNCIDIDGTQYCVDPGDGTGTYPTLDDCVATSCLPPPVPPPPPSWNCIDIGGGIMRCVDPGDGTGAFSVLADCEAVPCGAPLLPYFCIAGMCAFDALGGGEYATFEACAAACGAVMDTSPACGSIHPTSTGGTFAIDSISGACPGFVIPGPFTVPMSGQTCIWVGTPPNSASLTIFSDGSAKFFYRTPGGTVYYVPCQVWGCDDGGKMTVKGQIIFTGDPCYAVVMNFTITLD